MTWCEGHFQAFNNAIKIDSMRRARINSAILHLVDFCNGDDQLSAAQQGDIFLQGSVATKSVIKPLVGDEFDVDLIYPFNLNAFDPGTSPGQIMAWFESRFQASDFYAPRLIDKDRCVRIDYAGDFHLDVTAATTDVVTRQPFAIATKDSHEWERSDPTGFVNWVEVIDGRSENADADGIGRFVRCIRYMKRWRDTFFSEVSAPASILLVTVMGKHDPSQKNYNPPIENSLYPEYQTDAAYLSDMLRLTHSCIIAGKKTAFLHPTLMEDLGSGWAEDHLTEFMNRLSSCVANLRSAIYADAIDASVLYYKAALGNTFPG